MPVTEPVEEVERLGEGRLSVGVGPGVGEARDQRAPVETKEAAPGRDRRCADRPRWCGRAPARRRGRPPPGARSPQLGLSLGHGCQEEVDAVTGQIRVPSPLTNWPRKASSTPCRAPATPARRKRYARRPAPGRHGSARSRSRAPPPPPVPASSCDARVARQRARDGGDRNVEPLGEILERLALARHGPSTVPSSLQPIRFPVAEQTFDFLRRSDPRRPGEPLHAPANLWFNVRRAERRRSRPCPSSTPFPRSRRPVRPRRSTRGPGRTTDTFRTCSAPSACGPTTWMRGPRCSGRSRRTWTRGATSWLRSPPPPRWSSYCALAHGSVLYPGRAFSTSPTSRRSPLDYRNAGLDPVDVAVMDFAVAVVRDAAAITRADLDGLRTHGLSDAEICDVVAAAAARCFFCKFIDALGALRPDAAYADLAPRAPPGADQRPPMRPDRQV